MAEAIPNEIVKTLSSLREIIAGFLDSISRAASPHTLDELIKELRPRMVGHGKEWYDYIEEGRGLHGEVLSLITQENCNRLSELELQLSEQLSPLFLSKGIGAKIRQKVSVSPSERRHMELAEHVFKTSEEIREKIQDIEAQTHGFYDRTRQSTAYHPLQWQILTVYDLMNTLQRFERELSQITRYPAPVISTIATPSELLKRLERLGITTVIPYLEEANKKLLSDEYPECCHESRKALEEMIAQVANLVTNKPVKRSFRDALEVLKVNLKLPEDTLLTIGAKDVGLYGWLSIKGGHSEATSRGQEAMNPFEARLAVNWTLSVITMIADAYEIFLSSELHNGSVR